MSEYKPIKIKRKKRADSNLIRAIIFRAVPIILVIVIAICSFSIFDKRISEILADSKYGELANRGSIDDPSLDTYDPIKVDWSSAYTTTGSDGFDPLLLSPLTETNQMKPSDMLGTTEFERALGYTNKQSILWSLNESVNNDIVAWIYMYGMGINYPIAKENGKKNYYLTHSYDGTPSTSGTLFMSDACSVNPISRNIILHGHNMRDGTMFATLNNYLEGTRAYYDSHKYVFLDTLYGTYRYEIYSVYKTTPSNIYLYVDFDSNTSFINWCNQTNNRGIYKDSNVIFTPYDRILTLSTCDRSGKSRIIVHAKLVYPNPEETLKDDPNALIPDDPNAMHPTIDEEQDPSTLPDETPVPTASPTETPAPPLNVATPTPEIPFQIGSIYRIKLSDQKSTLRLRSKASTTSTVLAGLANGTQLTILSNVNDEWVMVKTVGGMEGYLQKRFLISEKEFFYTTPSDNIGAPSSNLITPTT